MSNPFLNYDLQMLPPDDEETPTPQKIAIRQFECVGCGQKRPYSIAVNYNGQPHDHCKQTNGVIGYWVELPVEYIDPPEQSAAEIDYIESWEDYL